MTEPTKDSCLPKKQRRRNEALLDSTTPIIPQDVALMDCDDQDSTTPAISYKDILTRGTDTILDDDIRDDDIDFLEDDVRMGEANGIAFIVFSDWDRKGCSSSSPDPAFQNLVFDRGLHDLDYIGPDFPGYKATTYFSDLFVIIGPPLEPFLISGLFPTLDEAVHTSLATIPLGIEIKVAIFSMAPLNHLV
ncbi:hypothetical protein V6N13_001900 [Hibiscus sabdariffa]